MRCNFWGNRSKSRSKKLSASLHAVKSLLLFLFLSNVVINTSCEPSRKSLEKAERCINHFFQKFGNDTTAQPPYTRDQWEIDKGNEDFLVSHPKATIAVASKKIQENPNFAWYYLSLLSRFCSKESESYFLRLLDEPNFLETQYRNMVIDLLKRIKSRKAVPRLIQLGEISKSRVWENAHISIALGEIGDKRATKYLCSLLSFRANSNMQPVVEASIKALGELKDKSTVDLLIEILSDRKINNSLRASSASALVKIGDKRALIPLKQNMDIGIHTEPSSNYFLWMILNLAPEQAVQNCIETGDIELAKYLESEDAIPWCLTVMNNEDATNKQRQTAIRLLIDMRHPDVIPIIKRGLLLQNTWVTQSHYIDEIPYFLEVLEKYHDPDAGIIRFWLKYFRKERTEYDFYAGNRRYFLRLCMHGTVEDASDVIWYLKSGHKWYSDDEQNADRKAALEFFIRNKGSVMLPILMRELDKGMLVDKTILRAIGAMGSSKQAHALLEYVRRYFYLFDAAEAIIEINDRSVVPFLLDMIKSENRLRNYAAAYCLARMGEDSGKQVLFKWIRQDMTDLDWQQGALDGGELDVIKLLKDPDSLPLLHQAMKQAKKWQNYSEARIAETLAYLGDKKGVDVCVEYLGFYSIRSFNKELLQAIVASNISTTKHIRSVERFFLEEESDEIQKMALRALGKIGDAHTLHLLYSYPIGKRRKIINDLRAAVIALESKYPRAAKKYF